MLSISLLRPVATDADSNRIASAQARAFSIASIGAGRVHAAAQKNIDDYPWAEPIEVKSIFERSPDARFFIKPIVESGKKDIQSIRDSQNNSLWLTHQVLSS